MEIQQQIPRTDMESNWINIESSRDEIFMAFAAIKRMKAIRKCYPHISTYVLFIYRFMFEGFQGYIKHRFHQIHLFPTQLSLSILEKYVFQPWNDYRFLTLSFAAKPSAKERIIKEFYEPGRILQQFLRKKVLLFVSITFPKT